MSGDRPIPPSAVALIAVCAFAFAVRFLPARVVPNMVWPDEVFQSVEQAHRVVYGNGVVPWEFRDGLRSWLLPGALAGVVAATGWTSAGSSGYLDGVAAVLSLLALAPVVAAFAVARRRPGGGTPEAVTAAFAVACWFELACFGPKALAEVVAAHLLVAGLLLADPEASPTRRRLGWAGACLGLAVALRVHLAPAVLVGGAWLAWRGPGRAWVALLAGAAVPIAVAGLLDLATWGAPFASYLNNFRANVLEGRSAAYGVADWDAYLRVVARVWWAGALLVVPAAAIGALLRPAWAVTAAVVLLTHSLMGHKEYRFVFPAIAIALVLAGVGTAKAVARVRVRWGTRGAVAVAAIAAVAWAGTSGALAWRFTPQLTNLTVLEQPASSHWTRLTGVLSGMERLSGDDSVCGVALAVPWFVSGGWSYLHRDVPIHEVAGPGDLARIGPAANALIVHRGDAAGAPGYRIDECFLDGMCVLRRDGGCTPVPGYDLNALLKERGE